MPQGLDKAIAINKTTIAATAACLFLLALPGRAHADGRRVAILPFDGPYGDRAQNIARAALPADCELVPTAEVVKAVKHNSGKVDTPSELAAVARRVDASIILDGRIKRDARWRLRLNLRSGSDGKLAGTFNRSGQKFGELIEYTQRDAPRWMRAAIRRHFGGGATEAVASADPAPAEGSSDAVTARGSNSEPEGELSAGPAARSSTSHEPMWEVSLGPRLLTRSFTYTDNVSGLPGHTMSPSPALQVEGEVYPLASMTSSFVRNFGLAGHFETTLGARTAAFDGSALSTTDLTYRVGPRYRLSQVGYVVLGGVDYTSHRFQMSGNQTGVISPDVVYSILRPSVSGRFYTGGGVSLAVTIAYLHVLSAGVLDQAGRFPRMTALGAEASFGVGYNVYREFDVRLIADLRHYAHAMHVRAGDPLIVGGAVDDHFGAALVLAYRSQ
jgi:hypothetical protein